MVSLDKKGESKSCGSLLRIFLLIIMYVWASNTYGGSGTVNKVWLDHGSMKNGEKGMKIHADINVIGLKGNKIEVLVYFYDNDKNKLTGGTGSYKASDGQVCASDTDKSTYDNCHWSNFDIFIPYSAIPFKDGTHDYYIKVRIYDRNNGTFIDNNNNFVCFSGTGSGNNNNKVNVNGKIVKPFYPSGDNKKNYLTFDGNTCYWSDAYGNMKEYSNIYTYRLESGSSKMYCLYSYGAIISTMYIESDYSRLSWFSHSQNSYYVYYNRPNQGEKFPVTGKIVGDVYPSGSSSYGSSGSSYGGSYNGGVSKTCTFCHGTGLRPSSIFENSVRYSTNRSYTYCNRCGSTHLVLDRHENCGVCKGTGRVVE